MKQKYAKKEKQRSKEVASSLIHLHVSQESFVKGDLLEADNAYDCAICNKKVDALKRVCVKTLPHALIVHLKRFDFDYETMQRLKVKVGTASFKQFDPSLKSSSAIATSTCIPLRSLKW